MAFPAFFSVSQSGQNTRKLCLEGDHSIIVLINIATTLQVVVDMLIKKLPSIVSLVVPTVCFAGMFCGVDMFIVAFISS